LPKTSPSVALPKPIKDRLRSVCPSFLYSIVID
jgi:hypothetical protein